MKRRELLRHLTQQGCQLIREGARHTVLYNPKNNATSTVPRHREVDDSLARKICRDLHIPPPR
ncbi:MAG: type II toxin-antitoxin system HicA family toxin [Terriglobia bacterium]